MLTDNKLVYKGDRMHGVQEAAKYLSIYGGACFAMVQCDGCLLTWGCLLTYNMIKGQSGAT